MDCFHIVNQQMLAREREAFATDAFSLKDVSICMKLS
jgi:hypothetical protein